MSEDPSGADYPLHLPEVGSVADEGRDAALTPAQQHRPAVALHRMGDAADREQAIEACLLGILGDPLSVLRTLGDSLSNRSFGEIGFGGDPLPVGCDPPRRPRPQAEVALD